jgi:hypothetical protein
LITVVAVQENLTTPVSVGVNSHVLRSSFMNSVYSDYLLAKDRLYETINALAEEVKNLPENPRIFKYPGSTVNAFIIKLSDLGKEKSLLPEYHCFSIQYKVLADKIKDYPLHIVEFLKELNATKKVKSSGVWYYIHPEVITNVNNIFLKEGFYVD